MAIANIYNKVHNLLNMCTKHLIFSLFDANDALLTIVALVLLGCMSLKMKNLSVTERLRERERGLLQ